jgi:hypothetical protein
MDKVEAFFHESPMPCVVARQQKGMFLLYPVRHIGALRLVKSHAGAVYDPTWGMDLIKARSEEGFKRRA